ncbi:unnamed protein product [Triticum turgidum subsp. durum]|uniref:4-hydroxy-4-methyl-2-oxoglutarate aldolase n=1 Tax=Triticum turgidum subsp. durum TaxID=4567 RepID=A0A9R0ZST2_TRITD|nr:unnamed protein product [Triticum turgidum subsp. durum]
MAALPLATAEVCDANSHLITGGELRALQPIFQIYGRRQVFAGPIVTLKVFEDEINGCDIGVRALASHPMKANKKGMGEKHVPVTIAGTRICDGEWLYADTDGILVSRTELIV